MAAQYTTTKEGHTADFAGIYNLPGSTALTLQQTQRSLLQKDGFEIDYRKVITFPDAVRFFRRDAITLCDKKWLETCTVNVHEFCQLPVATQQQQLLNPNAPIDSPGAAEAKRRAAAERAMRLQFVQGIKKRGMTDFEASLIQESRKGGRSPGRRR